MTGRPALSPVEPEPPHFKHSQGYALGGDETSPVAQVGIGQVKFAVFDALAGLDYDSFVIDLPNESNKLGLVRISTGETWVVTIEAAKLMVTG